MTRVTARVLILLLLGGCGYSFNSRTAKDIKSIAVPFFVNRTPEPNLEIQVTELVIESLIRDNTLKVVQERDADAVLEGVIVGFENRPFSFNSELNAEEYHVVVRVEASLFSRAANAPIWEKKVFKGDGSYFVDAAVEGLSFEEARQEAVFEITEQILNLTVQDW